MKIGSHIGDGSDLSLPFQVAAQHNFSCFQSFIGPQHHYKPYLYSQEQITKFRQTKEQTGLMVAIHGNYVVNIAYDGPTNNRYKLGIQSIKEQLELCDQLGAEFLVMHCGSFKEEGIDKGIDDLVRAVEAIMLMYQGKTHLLIENSAGGGTQIGKVNYLLRAMGLIQHPGVALCFDTVHAFAEGWDMGNVRVREEMWGRIKPYVRWIHYNNPDPKVSIASHLDRHQLPWSQAKWPQETMIEIAKEAGDLAPLCLECGGLGAVDFNAMVLEEAGLL